MTKELPRTLSFSSWSNRGNRKPSEADGASFITATKSSSWQLFPVRALAAKTVSLAKRGLHRGGNENRNTTSNSTSSLPRVAVAAEKSLAAERKRTCGSSYSTSSGADEEPHDFVANSPQSVRSETATRLQSPSVAAPESPSPNLLTMLAPLPAWRSQASTEESPSGHPCKVPLDTMDSHVCAQRSEVLLDTTNSECRDWSWELAGVKLEQAAKLRKSVENRRRVGAPEKILKHYEEVAMKLEAEAIVMKRHLSL